jgi:signal transduction histidine kinase
VSSIVSRLEERAAPLTRVSLARYGVGVAALAVAYYLTAKAGLRLAYLHGAVTALWPPVGVGVAALALGGARLWPGVVIGDLLVGDFSTPLGTVLGQTAGNTLEVLAAALLLRRLTAGRLGMERVVDVFALVAAAAVGTAISASFGVVSLRLGDVIPSADAGEVWRTWWLSDLSGALVVAPVVLVWAAVRTARVDRRVAVEAAVLLAVLVALIEVPSQRDVPYIVFPALIWAALRFGAVGAATAVLITSSLTVWNTAHDAGPFVRSSITDSLLSTQLFIAVAALTSLVLAAAMAERRRAGDALRASEAAHRALAHEQAALRRLATLVASDAPPARVFEQVTDEVCEVLAAPSAAVFRFDADPTATVVGRSRGPGAIALPLGSTIPVTDGGVLARVRATGEPERVESYTHEPGAFAEQLRALGVRSTVAAPVVVGGELWGALVASSRGRPFADGAERRLADFAELVAQALANADAYEKLAASRARIVEAGDTERRRLERNLHDGAQQRLVSLALQLRIAAAKVRDDPPAAQPVIAAAQLELDQALEELRELARGIHPAVLSERGLTAALAALVERAPVPVELTALPDERLPEPVEAAIYYVVAEALTNVAKYADATHAEVCVERRDGLALAVVEDDGVGGAAAGRGSGLRGLADRIEALGGRLRVESPPGAGTRLTAEIPLR